MIHTVERTALRDCTPWVTHTRLGTDTDPGGQRKIASLNFCFTIVLLFSTYELLIKYLLLQTELNKIPWAKTILLATMWRCVMDNRPVMSWLSQLHHLKLEQSIRSVERKGYALVWVYQLDRSFQSLKLKQRNIIQRGLTVVDSSREKSHAVKRTVFCWVVFLVFFSPLLI